LVHGIGVHFYGGAYDLNNKEQLEKSLQFEKRTIEFLLDTQVSVFSYHNPFPQTLIYDDYKYSGMINTYSQYFKKNTSYCSDSNGYWRFKRLEDFLLENKSSNLQVLTHPEWWQKEPMAPTDRVWRSIDGRAKKLKENYIKLLTSNGRIVVR